MESNKKSDIFLRSGLSHYKFNLKDEWIEEIKDHEINDFNFQKVRERVSKLEVYQDSNYVLWNGFSSRIQERKYFTEKEIQLDNLAVARGASDYGSRLKAKLPTYLDTLPGLDILTTVKGKGEEPLPIIKKGRVEGGKTKYIEDPIKGISLKKNTKVFKSILRNSTENTYKMLETNIPKNDYEVPIVIKGQMRPANGNALVTIEGDSGYEGIFGERSQIELNWKSMKPYVFTQYSGPSFYPVKGRITDDKNILDIVQGYIDRGFLDKGYIDIHKPQGDPTRPLFGAEDEQDPIIDELAEGISSLIQALQFPIYRTDGDSKRHQYLNYMFKYAPESFIQELRDLYSKTDPPITSWNTVYAVGRTFHRSKDFELFVDFFLEKSKELGYPAYKDTTVTKCYYWSFFRALCYYEHTVNIPVEKVEKVLLTLCKVVEDRRSDNWQPRPSWAEKNRWARNAVMNLRKFLLSCILFSLRFRKIDPNFLDLDSELYKKMEDLVNHKIPKTPYPRAMFSAVQKDSLNDYVYRFLSKEQTDSDLEAIKGLITSI